MRFMIVAAALAAALPFPALPRTHYAVGAGCSVQAPKVAGGRSTPSVPRWPAHAWVVYVPGSRDARCTATRRLLPARVADDLARDIDRAPVVRGGPYACPADDGTEAVVSFDYARTGAPRRFTVAVKARGCRWVDGSGLVPRWVDRAVAIDLKPYVPSNVF